MNTFWEELQFHTVAYNTRQAREMARERERGPSKPVGWRVGTDSSVHATPPLLPCSITSDSEKSVQ
ncbi:hypothetical protein J6590_042686 [Homalodisca vitripennis]|nr:hypothetical protein J6590_042686 [Homalodisca vitripennis]